MTILLLLLLCEIFLLHKYDTRTVPSRVSSLKQPFSRVILPPSLFHLDNRALCLPIHPLQLKASLFLQPTYQAYILAVINCYVEPMTNKMLLLI